MYGKGVFEKAVGDDIAQLVPIQLAHRKYANNYTSQKVAGEKHKNVDSQSLKVNKNEDEKEKESVSNREGMERPGGNNQRRSFAKVLKSQEQNLPRFEGIVVQIDEEEHKEASEELQFSVVGKLILCKGELPHTTLDLKQKIVDFWGFTNFKIIPLGRGFYHVFLHSMAHQSKALRRVRLMSFQASLE